MTLSPNDCAWASGLGGDKTRPVVVLAVEVDRALVIYGVGTLRAEYPHVMIAPPAPAAFALKLSKATYFYKRNVARVPLALVNPTGMRCPLSAVTAIRKMLEEA